MVAAGQTWPEILRVEKAGVQPGATGGRTSALKITP
jgi:hypothetical protein